MSKFRMVHSAFWSDPKVEEDLTPEDKLFFLYLLTNEKTTQIGVYQITKRKMAFDLGYSLETVTALLDRFINHLSLLKYNKETKELAIKNWGRYNLRRSGKPMIDCLTSELKKVKDTKLITYVCNRIENKTIKSLYEVAANKQLEQEDNIEIEEHMDNDDVQMLFDHYVSKNIIIHKRITSSMERAIRARLKDYTFEELKHAINNYAFVYFSDSHWFTHKYPLADLMRDKDIRKFLDEADPIDNFSNKHRIQAKPIQLKKEDFDLS